MGFPTCPETKIYKASLCYRCSITRSCPRSLLEWSWVDGSTVRDIYGWTNGDGGYLINANMFHSYLRHMLYNSNNMYVMCSHVRGQCASQLCTYAYVWQCVSLTVWTFFLWIHLIHQECYAVEALGSSPLICQWTGRALCRTCSMNVPDVQNSCGHAACLVGFEHVVRWVMAELNATHIDSNLQSSLIFISTIHWNSYSGSEFFLDVSWTNVLIVWTEWIKQHFKKCCSINFVASRVFICSFQAKHWFWIALCLR